MELLPRKFVNRKACMTISVGSSTKVKFKISVRQNRTFLKRFGDNALWWGVPMLGMELFGVALRGWNLVLAIAIPATIAGVFAKTAVEHIFVSALAKRERDEAK